jgi:sulfonate transport system substrate-binding protein
MPIFAAPTRRRALGLFAALAALGLAGTVPAQAQTATASTAWGWPQPYEQVSPESVAWLKDKGWWPLTVGFQPPWTGHNAINIVADRLHLLQKRGIEAKFQPFTSGPELNEAFTAARIQVGGTGNFPYTSLVDRKVPVRGIVNYPVLTHAVVVPNDSPLKSIKDFKGAKEPHTVGIVTGSSSEFYFQAAAQANGVVIGKDVILKNIPIAEQLQLPKGITAVVPWDHSVSLLAEERKTGRIIDSSHPYSIYEGIGFVRQELIDNAPDVVQAITDSLFEANLFIRLDPAKAVELEREDPSLKLLDPGFLARQIANNNTLFKPTYLLPHPKFWADEDGRVRAWLKERNRLTRDLTGEEYAASYAPEFARNTVKKLGWKTPEQPVYLPKGWTGTIGQIPYPEYFNQTTAKAPQPFPEPGDLERPWTFGGKTYQP